MFLETYLISVKRLIKVTSSVCKKPESILDYQNHSEVKGFSFAVLTKFEILSKEAFIFVRRLVSFRETLVQSKQHPS